MVEVKEPLCPFHLHSKLCHEGFEIHSAIQAQLTEETLHIRAVVFQRERKGFCS